MSLKLFVFGKLEDSIEHIDIPEHVITITSEGKAWKIINELPYVESGIALKKILNIADLSNGDVIL